MANLIGIGGIFLEKNSKTERGKHKVIVFKIVLTVYKQISPIIQVFKEVNHSRRNSLDVLETREQGTRFMLILLELYIDNYWRSRLFCLFLNFIPIVISFVDVEVLAI